VHHLGRLGVRVGVAARAPARRPQLPPSRLRGSGRELRGVARQRAEAGELPLALAPGAHGLTVGRRTRRVLFRSLVLIKPLPLAARRWARSRFK
jgi:hypothetical protein